MALDRRGTAMRVAGRRGGLRVSLRGLFGHVLERVRSEHRLGQLKQRSRGAGWTKREHVFVKVPAAADGPVRTARRERQQGGNARHNGKFGRERLQAILHR